MKNKNSDKRPQNILRTGEVQIALFSICLVLFSWPFLGSELLGSVKGMFLYFFGIWGGIVVIHLLAGISKSSHIGTNNQD
jgi:hypothetical protein